MPQNAAIEPTPTGTARAALACAVTVLIAAGPALAAEPAGHAGRDLVPVFARAAAGGPLRAVAMGGSITQAGGGWIGPWLREQFPRSTVAMHNAGMSGTGSGLGVFRLARDVIAAQPDLVLIEFAVNDGGLSDENAVRYLESIVVRLKRLPHPPAIVFVEAAARGGANRGRHRKVAAHYGLLDVDLQPVVDGLLAGAGEPWSSLMSDNVHPNAAGHALYAQTIAAALAPFVAQARRGGSDAQDPPANPLPEPLSTKPLLLDGELSPISPAPGWGQQASLPAWWSRFFNGVVTSRTPGDRLVLPARGTCLGVFFAMDPSYGSFLVSLDGNAPALIDCSTRGGYGAAMLGNDLAACEHVVTVMVAAPVHKPPGPVKLGYLLVAGRSGATRAVAPQGDANLHAEATRRFAPVAADTWQWSGPYGGAEKTIGPTSDLQRAFAPEDPKADANWRPCRGEGPVVDFAALTGWKDRGVCYARTVLTRRHAGRALLALRLDYYGKLWVNGTLVRTIDRNHGGPNDPVLIPVELAEGRNTLLLKVHSGSAGNAFSLFVEEPRPSADPGPDRP